MSSQTILFLKTYIDKSPPVGESGSFTPHTVFLVKSAQSHEKQKKSCYFRQCKKIAQKGLCVTDCI